MRTYQAIEANIEIFHRFFNDKLYPVQLRHGARLVGRWQTEDYRVVAVWEYDDHESYERIQELVRNDPDSIKAQRYRKSLPPFAEEQEEVFMVDTVNPSIRNLA